MARPLASLIDGRRIALAAGRRRVVGYFELGAGLGDSRAGGVAPVEGPVRSLVSNRSFRSGHRHHA